MGRKQYHFHAIHDKDAYLNLIGGKRQTQIKKHSTKQLALIFQCVKVIKIMKRPTKCSKQIEAKDT